MILNGQDSPHFSKRHGLIGPGDQRVGRLNVFETTESSLERRDSVQVRPHYSRDGALSGARHSARGDVVEQHVEHGEQAQRSNHGPIACFGRPVVQNAG